MKIPHILVICLLMPFFSYGKKTAIKHQKSPTTQTHHWWRQYNLKTLSVVTVPVADMITQPIASTLPKSKQKISTKDAYAAIPIVSDEKTDTKCARTFQALFNDVIIKGHYNGQEFVGSLPHAAYTISYLGQPVSTYYTLADNVKPLSPRKRIKINLALVPPPLWHQGDATPVVTLMLPWTDTALNVTFSAGTRFVHLPQNDTQTEYAITFLSPFNYQSALTSYVPKTMAITQFPPTSDEKQHLFSTVLNRLIDETTTTIPYVWGGASISNQTPSAPYCGVDCSGLINLASHIAGFQNPYRNTTMLQRFLPKVMPTEPLKNGDLFLFSEHTMKHVMIVADVENNILIEASSYNSGYGNVHRVTVKDRFMDIENLDHLRKSCNQQQPILLKNINLQPFNNSKGELATLSNGVFLRLM